MRTVATFQFNTPTPNSSGGYYDDYNNLYSCRGKFEQLHGKRSDEQMELVRNRNYSFDCRFTTSLVIDTDTRVVIKGASYVITNYELVDEINHFYRFILSING